jgi:hypothetical protein
LENSPTNKKVKNALISTNYKQNKERNTDNIEIYTNNGIKVIFFKELDISDVNLKYDYDAITRLSGVIKNNTNYNWAGAGIETCLYDTSNERMGCWHGGTGIAHIAKNRVGMFIIEMLMNPSDVKRVSKIELFNVETEPDPNQDY